MGNFLRDRDLPKVKCKRVDIYDMVENLDPTSELVDDSTLKIVAGKIEVGASVPRWSRYIVNFDDVSIAALERTIELVALPSASVAHMVIMKHSLEFTGGGITAVTFSVGHEDEASPVTLLPASDVFQPPSNSLLFQQNTPFAFKHDPAGSQVLLKATSVGANLDALTQGSASIWINHAVLDIV